MCFLSYSEDERTKVPNLVYCFTTFLICNYFYHRHPEFDDPISNKKAFQCYRKAFYDAQR